MNSNPNLWVVVSSLDAPEAFEREDDADDCRLERFESGDIDARAVRYVPRDGPKIVCLCGSGRFLEAFAEAEFNETLAGKIVLTIGCNTHDIARSADLAHHKPMLDELHLRKIDMADEVLILNVGGYIGESTRRELNYAKRHGKLVRFLEPPTREEEPVAAQLKLDPPLNETTDGP